MPIPITIKKTVDQYITIPVTKIVTINHTQVINSSITTQINSTIVTRLHTVYTTHYVTKHVTIPVTKITSYIKTMITSRTINIEPTPATKPVEINPPETVKVIKKIPVTPPRSPNELIQPISHPKKVIRVRT